MLTLRPEDLADVRYAVAPQASPAGIPDALIQADPYAGRAARRIAAAVPTAEAMTEDDQAIVYRAILYQTAANLAWALPTITQSAQEEHRLTMNVEGYAERARRLELMADDELAMLPPAPAPARVRKFPPFMRLAEGSRY